MTLVTYPPNDEWTETLTPIDGNWTVTPDTGLVLDTERKNGNYSVRMYFDWNYFIPIPGPAGLYFNLDTPFNANRRNAKVGVIFRFQGWSYFTPWDIASARIELIDVHNNIAWRGIGATQDVWDARQFAIGDTAIGWIKSSNFDWTNVAKVAIVGDRANVVVPPAPPGAINVDAVKFTYESVKPVLRIISNPKGRHFNIDGAGGYTPLEFGLDPNVLYTVKMDATGFLKWEDETTNPSRNIMLVEGESKTIEAIYEGATPPDGNGFDLLSSVAVIGAVVGVGGVLYYLWRRRRRRT